VLKEGDELSLGTPAPETRDRIGARIGEQDRPVFARDVELRVMIGLCAYRLSEESAEGFLSAEWTVTPDADRVGYRYRGVELTFVEREPPFGAGHDPSNVVDVGYPVGSVQIPGGVEPILLLNDAVTGGGYATIATVISADRDRVAQSRTHDKTRFRAVGLDEALEARADRRRRLEQLRSQLAA
jgi:allophanate hydrolase subunit 2